MILPGRRAWRALLVAGAVSSPLAGLAQAPAPDAAAGPVEERRASAIEFESVGELHPGQGLTADVRLVWHGTAASLARNVYAAAAPEQLLGMAADDAARSGFHNFTVRAARLVDGESSGDPPRALEYHVRQVMLFGDGGRAVSFYVPVPRVLRRLAAPGDPLPGASEDVARHAEHDPPGGEGKLEALPARLLPVADVGRWAVRARYVLPDGLFAAAPEGRRIETDFAVYESRYRVEAREIVLERTLAALELALPADREADLQAFYEAVEADRRQTFVLTATAPGAETEADRLNEEGRAALQAGELERAKELLTRAADLDERHRWASHNLGLVRLRQGDMGGAIAALQHALAAYPGNPSARLSLAQALFMTGRAADAERALLEQVERTPWSVPALATIAGLYSHQQRHAEALPFWERAVDAAPHHEPAVLALGSTYLHLDRADDAVAAYMKGLRPSRYGTAENNAAFALAERGVRLDAAERLAANALDKLVHMSRHAGPDDGPYPGAEATLHLGETWDTTGWVAFRRGDAAAALPWLRAAWSLAELAEIGEHLGDVLVALDRPGEAAEVYAGAIARQPDAEGPRRKLARLEGVPPKERVALADRALTASRTLVADGVATTTWRGDLLVAHDRGGVVLHVEPFDGREPPPDVLRVVGRMQFPFVPPPDERDYRIERLVTVHCAAADATCTFRLWRSVDVPLR